MHAEHQEHCENPGVEDPDFTRGPFAGFIFRYIEQSQRLGYSARAYNGTAWSGYHQVDSRQSLKTESRGVLCVIRVGFEARIGRFRTRWVDNWLDLLG